MTSYRLKLSSVLDYVFLTKDFQARITENHMSHALYDKDLS